MSNWWHTALSNSVSIWQMRNYSNISIRFDSLSLSILLAFIIWWTISVDSINTSFAAYLQNGARGI